MSTRVDVCAPAEESEGTRSHVLRWLKAPGDVVVRDEPLIELETDKVTVEGDEHHLLVVVESSRE